VSVSGTRTELVQRLIEFEQSEDEELPAAVSAQSAAISQLQNEMKKLKDMLAQLVTVQMGNAAPAHAGNQQQHQIIDLDINEINNESIPVDATKNVRQASVKEIANTLPEFDPSDENAIHCPILHTTWKNFTEAIQDEFGGNPDEAEVHLNMTNATML